MIRVQIKPLSVNDAWKGQRYKSDAYKSYESDLMLLLPKRKILLEPKKKYQIYFKWGFSSKSSDFDNPIKPTMDVLSKRYGFNDKLLRRAVIETEIVPKGKEYFEFDIQEL